MSRNIRVPRTEKASKRGAILAKHSTRLFRNEGYDISLLMYNGQKIIKWCLKLPIHISEIKYCVF